MPPGFLTANRTTEGDRGEYLRVAGTRQTSTVSRYGSPAKDVAPVGIGSTPVKLLHSFESFTHDPTILNLLIEETGTGLVRQQMARETINRQLEVFGTRLQQPPRFLGLFGAHHRRHRLRQGGQPAASAEHTRLNTSTSAYYVNFGVPSGNTGSLSVFGTGTC